jgi:hypothetical protein
MRLESISPELSRGKGWARLDMRECRFASLIFSMCIVRPRYSESFLGEHGWQISEAKLPFSTETLTESEFSFLISPSVVHYLDVNSNYEFKFFDKGGVCLETLILRWSGISFRLLGGKRSPIQVIQQLIATPVVHNDPPNIVPADDLWTPTEPPTEQENIPNTWTTPDAVQPTNISNDLVTEPKKFRRIACPQCGHEIFENMKICPFC